MKFILCLLLAIASLTWYSVYATPAQKELLLKMVSESHYPYPEK